MATDSPANVKVELFTIEPTWRHAIRVWWSWQWRVSIAGGLLSLVANVWQVLFSGALGMSGTVLAISMQIGGAIIVALVGLYFWKDVIDRDYGSFRVCIVPNANTPHVREIEPRPLTRREAGWIREILQTRDEWKDADISKTKVIAEGPCDEGLSMVLRDPEPNLKADSVSGYIGRIVIQTDDGGFIEVRLTFSDRRLKELFVLYVDPKHPKRTLPESWTEVSHHAYRL